MGDITNLKPFTSVANAQAKVYQANANMWAGISDQISRGIQAGQARRAALEERNRGIRDKEYALANQETDKLVQAKSNHKYTDQQLQQVGQKFKQEFYDAVKEYEASDKGDEARQKFETVKQRSLGSARTLGESIEKLGDQMDMFMDQARSGGISDAVNPAVRSFFADLNNPETPVEQFQIITDPVTGQLKYKGKTSDGHDVDFFLEDIANGENQFAPIAKADMPKVMNNLIKNVSNITRQEKYDWGTAEITDWDTIGQVLDGRIEELFSDPTNFKALASGLGYGYEELENARTGQAFKDEDGREITDETSLRDAMKQELLQQMETVIPHMNVQNQTLIQKTQQEQQNLEIKNQATSNALNVRSAIQSGDFGAYENKPATIKGLKGNIASIKTLSSGSVEVTVRSGQKGGAKQTFKPNDPQLYAILGGGDYNSAAVGLQELNRIDQLLVQ